MHNQKVIAAIARITRKRPEDIQGHLSLGTLGVSASFGLSALRSILESEKGASLPQLTARMSVDQVIGLVGSEATAGSDQGGSSVPVRPALGRPKSVPASTSKPTHRVALGPMRPLPTANLGMGMDMQDIHSLPEATDMRSHEFYVSHFSPEELSTASLRPDPRAHLCGIFCAKEAVKKSHPELLNLRMNEITVSHDETGRPILRVNEAAISTGRFKFILSITHTDQIAAATCLSIWDAG